MLQAHKIHKMKDTNMFKLQDNNLNQKKQIKFKGLSHRMLSVNHILYKVTTK